MIRFIKNTLLAILLLINISCIAQPDIIDKVVAVVGNNIVTKSQLESQYLQMENRHDKKDISLKHKDICSLLNQLLFQKLLLAQAVKDSVTVTDQQVDGELDRRMRYFIGQFGSEAKFVEFYGKSIDDFKNELRENIKDLLVAQKMNSKITDGITVSPSEIRQYYGNIPTDSLPYINEEVEIGEIIKKPMINNLSKIEAKRKLTALRDRIMKGEDFAALAALYSQDPGSAVRGGLMDSITRGRWVPEFEAAAFTSKINEISPVFETVYGYHIIQVLAIRGEVRDVRHMLITPESSQDDIVKSKNMLDSIYDVIQKDSINFNDAASKFSDDEDGKTNGGLISNPQTGATKFEKSDLGLLDPTMAFTIDKMKVGDMTRPSVSTSKDGKQVYRILFLKSRSEPHVANLKDDYQKIQNAAQREKQQKVLNAWIKKKLPGNYVKIDNEFKNCVFDVNWFQNN